MSEEPDSGPAYAKLLAQAETPGVAFAKYLLFAGGGLLFGLIVLYVIGRVTSTPAVAAVFLSVVAVAMAFAAVLVAYTRGESG